MSVEDSAQSVQTKGFFGHPGGLSTLFFTEMWERFSFYGMRALLMLYMTAAIAGTVVDGEVVTNGGMGLTTKTAAAIYGLYTASVYFLPLIGGWVADRYIGAKKATFIGGCIIASGHFVLAVPALWAFYAGLVLVAVGTGFLKSNISAMVGDLYEEGDERRDGGFSIFYMGINLGAFAAPLVCGLLATYNWHYGFAIAGVGMVIGLIQYIVGKDKLDGVGEAPVKLADDNSSELTPTYLIQVGITIAVGFGILVYSYLTKGMDFTLTIALIPVLVVGGLIIVLFTGMMDKLTTDDWKRIGIIVILFLFAALFWAGFEQAGSSFNLFADQLTDRNFGSWEMPTAWFQSVNAIMIVIMAPIFGVIWVKLGSRQPNDVFKFALGLFLLALGFVVMAYAAGLTGAGKVSPMWLVVVYFLHTCGELCLSPVGLSSMTKLAPGKMVGLMLGVWFLASSLGLFAAGQIAGEFDAKSTELESLIVPDFILQPLGIASEQAPLVALFGNVAIVVFIGAALAILLSFVVGGFLKSNQQERDTSAESA